MLKPSAKILIFILIFLIAVALALFVVRSQIDRISPKPASVTAVVKRVFPTKLSKGINWVVVPAERSDIKSASDLWKVLEMQPGDIIAIIDPETKAVLRSYTGSPLLKDFEIVPGKKYRVTKK